MHLLPHCLKKLTKTSTKNNQLNLNVNFLILVKLLP